MPQLDFILYSYQFILLFVSFFILYDLILNYWLPAFLSCFYITKRNDRQVMLCASYTHANSFFERYLCLTHLYNVFSCK